MPVFLQGRRAFFIIPAPPTSPLQPLISPPRHQFGPRLPAPRLPRCGHLSLLPSPRLLRCRRLSLLPSPRLPRCGCRLPLLPFLVYPAAATCHSYPHLVYPAAADFGYRSAARHAPLPLGPNSRTIRAPSPILPKAPPRPASLLLFCPGPPSRLCPGHKKGGRNRTEARPPPKSNQSVAAASPRQVIWLSGKSPFLKVGIRTPGNTRSSPAPKRTVFRYRAALRKVHHQANKATSRRSRTDN